MLPWICSISWYRVCLRSTLIPSEIFRVVPFCICIDLLHASFPAVLILHELNTVVIAGEEYVVWIPQVLFSIIQLPHISALLRRVLSVFFLWHVNQVLHPYLTADKIILFYTYCVQCIFIDNRCVLCNNFTLFRGCDSAFCYLRTIGLHTGQGE